VSDKKKRKRPVNPRRTFTVREQLVAKHGDEIVELVQGLATRPKRRRRRRKPVAA
jgi:hypothetical protein